MKGKTAIAAFIAFAFVLSSSIAEARGGGKRGGGGRYYAKSGKTNYSGYSGYSGGRSGGCGSRGGPGYRKANGQCASWKD